MYQFYRLVALCATLTLSVYATDELANEQNGKIIDLRPYTITGTVNTTELGNTLIPTIILDAEQLKRSSEYTLGEMLKNTAGIHSTAFGRGASRPIIRGIGDHRVHVMENGMGTSDVSANSPDHAVAASPQFADYIDIVRGPATLLYGNSAVGGVVNVIGNQILSPDDTTTLQDEFVIEYETVSDSINAFTKNSIFGEKWAISANLSRLEQNDYRIPGSSDSRYALEEFHEEGHDDEHEDEHEEHGESEADKLPNSFVDSKEANVSLFLFPNEESRYTLSLFGMEKDYGVPGHVHHNEDHDEDEGNDEHEHEDDHDEDGDHDEHEEHGVYVDLKQHKANIDGKIDFDGSLFEQVKFKVQYSDYEHFEIEGDEVGTFFSKESIEMRVEGIQRFSEQNSGVAGIQFSNVEEDSEGDETLTPASESRNIAFFVLEEWDISPLAFSFGMRAENQKLEILDQKIDDWVFSTSGAIKYELSDDLNFNATISRSERAPNVTELFADGAHIATRQYEIGDSGLNKETVWSFDASLLLRTTTFKTSLNVFYYSFSDYIFAAPHDHYMHGLQVFEYTAEDVSFYGFEFETAYTSFDDNRGKLTFSCLLDSVETEISDSSEELPRIPPTRLGLGADFVRRNWRVWSSYRYAFKQDEYAENEYPTDSYHQLDLGLEYSLQRKMAEITLFVKASNILDEEIRVHTSFLKDLAPLPGRNISLGLNFSY